MPIVVNSNPAATAASVNLNQSNELLQRSLNRLSSGRKIVNPADDAGGLAVSMKITAALKRTEAVNTNLSNAISYLQTQDGAMETAGTIIDRISELKTLANDVTKSPSDVANYDAEFDLLKNQLSNLTSEQFNGVALFQTGGGTKSVVTNESGSQTISITVANLTSHISTLAAAADLSDITISDVTTAIQSVATSRATNGAESSRLQFASSMLTVNRTNLEAANSRIIDTDVAAESTAFARYNILVQSGTAMLTQANATASIALRLLG